MYVSFKRNIILEYIVFEYIVYNYKRYQIYANIKKKKTKLHYRGDFSIIILIKAVLLLFCIYKNLNL